MDPKQALLDALSHLADNDRDAARECMDNYYEWIRKGGFEPTFTGRTIADAIERFLP